MDIKLLDLRKMNIVKKSRMIILIFGFLLLGLLYALRFVNEAMKQHIDKYFVFYLLGGIFIIAIVFLIVLVLLKGQNYMACFTKNNLLIKTEEGIVVFSFENIRELKVYSKKYFPDILVCLENQKMLLLKEDLEILKNYCNQEQIELLIVN